MIFVSIALDITRVGVLRKYETEKFSGSSLNRFIKAKNLVFLISKISYSFEAKDNLKGFLG